MNKLSTLITAGCLSATAAFATPLQETPFKTADGSETSLQQYAGKVLLIVNVASRCGNTPQYEQLQKLQTTYGSKGFTVLGFPCNDFGGQEPGSLTEIKSFCQVKFGVSFPLFDKIHVKGPEQAPLYRALTGPEAKFPGDVTWNFGKFLIGRDGQVVARFEPKTKPDDATVVTAIENALNQS